MRVHVLGCAGAELPQMNMPAFLIDRTILLDAGTIGLALNIAEQGRIRHIFVTHAHLDHIKAIPFFADNIVSRERPQKVVLHSDHKVLHILRRNLFNDLLWPDFSTIPRPEDAVIEYHGMGLNRPLHVDGYTVTAYRANHPTPSVGYLLEDPHGTRLVYTGDTGPSEELWQSCERRVHGLIVEVSFPSRMEERALLTGHLTPSLLEREFAKMREVPERIFVTHPKPAFLDEIREEVEALGRDWIEILEDGRIMYLGEGGSPTGRHHGSGST